MNLKKMVVGSLIGAATMASPAAFAGLTANVGAFSSYMWRGLPQTTDAAVQGGLDYSHESGLYVGTWGSNLNYGGGTEQDFYVGFAGSSGAFKYDLGVIYEWVPEDGQLGEDWSTLEFYAAVGAGPVMVKYFYADEQNFLLGDGEGKASGYVTASLVQPLTDKLSFTAVLSNFHGKEVERYLESLGEDDKNYYDYSIGLAATIDGGYTAAFQYIDTDISNDDPKFVVSLKKTFDL